MGPRGAVAMCYGTTGFLNALWGATLPATDARLNLGAGRLGLLLMVLATAALVAMPVAGWLADQWTGRRLLRFAGVAAALAMAGVGSAPSVGLLYLATAVLGVLSGGLNVALSVQAVAVEREMARPLMATMHGTWTLGAVLGGAVISAGLRSGVGVQALMIAGAAVTAIISLAAGPHLAGPQSVAPAGVVGSRAVPTAVVAHRPGMVVALGMIGAAAFLTEGAATDWAGVHASRVLGADLATASLIYTVFFVAVTAVRFVGDAARARIGVPATIRLTCAVAAVGFVLVLSAPWLPVTSTGPSIACAVIGWALAGAGTALVWPIVASTLGAANAPGRRLAAATTISYGGGLAGPALIGFVAERATLPVALLIPAALAFALALVAPATLSAAAGVRKEAAVS